MISIRIYFQYPPIKKLGLDEFVMDYDKDPYNIYFHTGRLNISKLLIVTSMYIYSRLMMLINRYKL